MAYLWRNRSLSKTSEQLNSIVGILIFNLVLGGIQDTSIDNIGEHSLLFKTFYATRLLMDTGDSVAGQHTILGKCVSKALEDAL